MGVFENFTDIRHDAATPPWKASDAYINEREMKRSCADLVEQFCEDGKFEDYAESGLEDRIRILTSFYDEVKETMGIDADFYFVPMPYGMQGGYEPGKNSIELNINSLMDDDCSGLLNTILHESRHAFQHRAIEDPSSVSVDIDTINAWRENIENYIAPWFDYEAYREQPVETDAFDYADSIIPETTAGESTADDNELAENTKEQDSDKTEINNNQLT